VTVAREHELAAARADGSLAVQTALHVDDLSSDDEEGGNAIGRVPLRWFVSYFKLHLSLDFIPNAPFIFMPPGTKVWST